MPRVPLFTCCRQVTRLFRQRFVSSGSSTVLRGGWLTRVIRRTSHYADDGGQRTGRGRPARGDRAAARGRERHGRGRGRGTPRGIERGRPLRRRGRAAEPARRGRTG